MPDSKLERVTADLQHLQDTLGLGPNVDHAIGHALLAGSGLISLAWTAVAPSRWHFLGLLSVLVPVAYLIALRVKHRSSVGGSPAVRREFADALSVLTLGIPIVIYTFWAQFLGMAPLLVLSTVIFFVGVMVVGGAARHGVMLGWGLAIMAGALLIPLGLVSPVAAIATVLIVGGSVSALIAHRHNSAVR